jgi:hypothetical protein
MVTIQKSVRKRGVRKLEPACGSSPAVFVHVIGEIFQVRLCQTVPFAERRPSSSRLEEEKVTRVGLLACNQELQAHLESPLSS